VSTLSPGCCGAGITGPAAWNERARKPSSWDPWPERGALTGPLGKRNKSSAYVGDFCQA